MRDTWKAAKVGLLIIGGAIASLVVWRFVDERVTGGHGYTVWAEFDDAQGLIPKSRVLVAGIQVGTIQRIRLVNGKARLDIHIDEGVDLHSDSAIVKRSASLLGEYLLVIFPGSLAPKLKDGDRIPTTLAEAGIADVTQNANIALESVKNVATQLERVFGTDEGGQRMQSALRNLSEALEAINLTIQQNEQAFGDTIQRIDETTEIAGPKILRILDNVEQVTADVRGIIGNNKGRLEESAGEVADAVSSIRRASEQLEVVLRDVQQVTGRAARGEGTIGRLSQDETLIDEVEGVAEGLGDIVGTIGRLQTIVGLQSEYNFFANTFKNYVSLRLQPREDRYYLFQLINDPRGLTKYTKTTVYRSPPADGEPAFYQENRVTTTDDFRFSIMFAKRIAFATFRFGILESTGGIGVDFHLFDDRLELNFDIFAVGDSAFPRLRARLAYEIINRFWMLGGVDDFLNDSTDFFLGAMLRFNDEDLKAILPFAGGAQPTS